MNIELSILTATYNRAKSLDLLYSSLCMQNKKNFEWIVLDDGSNDKTKEVVNSYIKKSKLFPIKLVELPHGGKHRAINAGVKIAVGKYIFIVDSDDYLLRNSTEIISKWANYNDEGIKLAGFAGIRISPNGHMIGDFPKIRENTFVYASNIQRYRKHLLGDKAEVYKKEVLLQYPFPEYKNESFITERICWDKIASDGYLLRWYNTPLYVTEYHEGGLSKTGANSFKGHTKNPLGYYAFIEQAMDILEPLEKVSYFREYNSFADVNQISLKERAKNINFTLFRYMVMELFQMPFLYLVRIILKIIRIIE